jgi:hypothetical protein
MAIDSGFAHWKLWFSHSYVSLPEGSLPRSETPPQVYGKKVGDETAGFRDHRKGCV